MFGILSRSGLSRLYQTSRSIGTVETISTRKWAASLHFSGVTFVSEQDMLTHQIRCCLSLGFVRMGCLHQHMVGMGGVSLGMIGRVGVVHYHRVHPSSGIRYVVDGDLPLLTSQKTLVNSEVLGGNLVVRQNSPTAPILVVGSIKHFSTDVRTYVVQT